MLSHEQACIVRRMQNNLPISDDEHDSIDFIGLADFHGIDNVDLRAKALAEYDASYTVVPVESLQIQVMVGCSDHGCIWKQPQGMGTNGGCNCEKELRRRLASLGYSLMQSILFCRIIRANRDAVKDSEGK